MKCICGGTEGGHLGKCGLELRSLEINSDEDLLYCAEVCEFGRYIGMICQNKDDKWAATWNMVPSEEWFYLENQKAAIRALRKTV